MSIMALFIQCSSETSNCFFQVIDGFLQLCVSFVFFIYPFRKHTAHKIFLFQRTVEKYVLSLWIHGEILPLFRYLYCTKRKAWLQMPSKIRLALCRMYPHATKFQNIVCYCLSCNTIRINKIMCISKHRMLLFIRFLSLTNLTSKPISKHRMLLFIGMGKYWASEVSIFQNIVCYCLSQAPFAFQMPCIHFKTSYVTVYLIPLWVQVRFIKYFKTSYVTVYLIRKLERNSSNTNFKTSYVTVYPATQSCINVCYRISKHRMLLFINSICAI